MKLATLRDNTRDGSLHLVSKDLRTAVCVSSIAANLQWALEHWSTVEPQLQSQYEQLNNTALNDIIQFSHCQLESPLPRAYQWADGSAYVNHVELVRKARGAEMPVSFWSEPLMYQGGSDSFLGPNDNIPLIDPAWGLDFEGEVAVITNDVKQGISSANASDTILLITLVNDVSLRNLIPSELAKGFGFFHSKPSTAFSPVAVTPDELGDAWDGTKLHLPLYSYLNDALFGSPDAGTDMTFDFPRLIAHAAKTRSLIAGTIIGSGTVSNCDRTVGSSCLAEKRMLEKIATGEITTPFLQNGDKVKIEMHDQAGQSIFGAIEQIVVKQDEAL
ncbi:fumarylacetoacetate hydrolase family protein [Moritella viscosa]|uniref:Fumarylacetoacetate hydrolase family protein n=1 Tax=Moritella viscosa TaxID=80854 RepID=A0A1K9ZSH7_9GAMM|nr:fumarylacetoacetate hydrolase family protein [Moritella viscosa]SGY99135.1 Fumarylacetoacetate hydrolase family protein [Moritella viscosa]SGY99500.1 Fumarylacetoacetate hydrolase family protein [Moritella viscosa]SGZ05524.1 Fumarylacetoacetate hydrolase family protein [Moritella viscosa]SHO08752.1 Fumarylacetoacetate hydrolase family protein [Moritella viscosa]SHO08808.1 Fumarylacetoacetate hydrolase family protein [Moritella viscosa]